MHKIESHKYLDLLIFMASLGLARDCRPATESSG